MSLRDQLLAKGLVTEKRAKKLDREQRDARRKEQSSKPKKRALEAERQKREAAEHEARESARRSARAEYEDQRAQTERALQVRNTILGNQVRSRGPVPFHHVDVHGRKIHRMSVSSGVAHQLRCGDAAIVADQGLRELEYVVVTRRAAEKLVQLAPRLIVFWARDAAGLGAPDLEFAITDWEPSLAPRRATPEELRRLGIPLDAERSV